MLTVIGPDGYFWITNQPSVGEIILSKKISTLRSVYNPSRTPSERDLVCEPRLSQDTEKTGLFFCTKKKQAAAAPFAFLLLLLLVVVVVSTSLSSTRDTLIRSPPGSLHGDRSSHQTLHAHQHQNQHHQHQHQHQLPTMTSSSTSSRAFRFLFALVAFIAMAASALVGRCRSTPGFRS